MSAGGWQRWASHTERLAVLLEAGLAPTAAWRHAAPEGTEAREGDIADALRAYEGSDAEPAHALAATWQVASLAGAPLGAALAALAETFHDLEQAAREREVALAGPRLTARVVLVLPALGIGVGLAVGLDVLGALLTTGAGLACLAGGVALMGAAVRWNRRLLRAAAAHPVAPGLAAELMAIAVSGGMPPERARGCVAGALGAIDPADGAVLDELLRFSRAAGVPVAALLRSEARAARRRARAEAQRRAAELSTRLVLPLGVCVLPSFVLLGVAPLGIALVSSTVLPW